MEKFNLPYSRKNIPIPSKHGFMQMLVAKTESFIRRMRWKLLAFDGTLAPSDKKTFGFRTMKYPPPLPELTKFEDDLMTMVRNIEFRSVKNVLQERMQADIKNIKASGKVVVAADKSCNLYKMDTSEYEKHLFNTIYNYFIQKDRC